MCVTFVAFTDCKSCTRPTSTNPGSIEAEEYRLKRGTCFFARRLEVVAVAGLLRLLLSLLGEIVFFVFSFFLLFFFERTRPIASVMSPLVSFTALLVTCQIYHTLNPSNLPPNGGWKSKSCSTQQYVDLPHNNWPYFFEHRDKEIEIESRSSRFERSPKRSKIADLKPPIKKDRSPVVLTAISDTEF